jgi:hypothetical protein
MSTDRLDRRLPEVLAELAPPVQPDYVDDLLGRTARMPQRPGWTYLERWIPVSTITLAQPTGRLPVRLLIAVALILILILATIGLYAGSQRRLPPLYGPAGNGLVVTTSSDGVITIDPATGASTTLVAGEDLCCLDVAPDGRHVAYLEVPVDGADPTAMGIAAMDGSTSVAIPDDLLGGLDWYEWSPAGERIAFASAGAVSIFDVASGAVSAVDTPFRAGSAQWIGTTGDLLATAVNGDTTSVYRFSPDAPAGVSKVADLRYVAEGISVSPDGSKIAYFIWGPEERLRGRVHVFDLATGVDTAITPEDEAATAVPHEVEGTVWSPDSSLIAATWLGADGDQIALLPAAGGAPQFVGPRMSLAGDMPVQFTPDGLSLLVQYPEGTGTWLLPVDGSAGRMVPWSVASSGYDWQRVAP